MSDTAHELEELVTYLARTSRLTDTEVARLVAEVLAFLDESAEAFIRRRHRELQHEGYGNSEIFSRIGVEVACRRFRAPAYTERQIRRIVYG
jgi:hypothetical protein